MTGCPTLYFITAWRTIWEDFSFMNLPLWQPIHTTALLPWYLLSRYSISGSVWRQLMQQLVQKCTITILFKSYRLNESSLELNQSCPFGNSTTRFYLMLETYFEVASSHQIVESSQISSDETYRLVMRDWCLALRMQLAGHCTCPDQGTHVAVGRSHSVKASSHCSWQLLISSNSILTSSL